MTEIQPYRYLPSQTILAGAEPFNSSWTHERPHDFSAYEVCFVYYNNATAQEIIFPKAISAIEFMVTLNQINAGRGVKVIDLVMDR